MMFRYGSSQKGFGLVKALGWIVLIGLILYFLPSLLSGVDLPITTELGEALGQFKVSIDNLLGRASWGVQGVKDASEDLLANVKERGLIFKEKILAKYGGPLKTESLRFWPR